MAKSNIHERKYLICIETLINGSIGGKEMKYSRLAVLTLTVILCLSLQGCTRTWFVDFTKANSISGWKQQDWSDSPHTAETGPEGLYVDGKILTSPFGFDGDFDVTLSFDLDTTENERVTYV